MIVRVHRSPPFPTLPGKNLAALRKTPLYTNKRLMRIMRGSLFPVWSIFYVGNWTQNNFPVRLFWRQELRFAVQRLLACNFMSYVFFLCRLVLHLKRLNELWTWSGAKTRHKDTRFLACSISSGFLKPGEIFAF